ncbi:hypothetical protein KBD20_00140 [Candidatus Saccharibacteria bacterium]|nr:hypothetical protein [Candidatus Saccharibacteria bacterium]
MGSRGNAVGEIASVRGDAVNTLFLGVPCLGALCIDRATLEGAGISVLTNGFFQAEVDLDAELPEQLQPSGFAPLPRQSELG